MIRPIITEFFHKITSVQDVQRIYSKCPQLFNYMVALENYIDQLESGFDTILNAPIPYNKRELQSWIETARQVAQDSQGVSI